MAKDTQHECDGLPFTRYMMAGAVAGMVEHVAMFPVDTIKTRMQVSPPAAGFPTADPQEVSTDVVVATRQQAREDPLCTVGGVRMEEATSPQHNSYTVVTFNRASVSHTAYLEGAPRGDKGRP
jgi:hypothetical protein